MSNSKIEWTDKVWNVVTGCTKISPGCTHCYAERMSKRLAGRCGYPSDDPFKVTLHPNKLEEPWYWKKPQKIFVCSMSDLFHDSVPFEFIGRVFAKMHNTRQHTFMVLTKRPQRMAEFTEWYRTNWLAGFESAWPKEYQHVWLGVTAENQEQADKRIPILLQIPAAVRFVSVEPMLGPVDLISNDYLGGCINCEVCLDNPKTCINRAQDRKIDWVICGGETGPGARPMHPNWVRSLRDQCQAANVPFLFKQWGEFSPDFDDRTLYTNVNSGINMDEPRPMYRIGKKKAGRLLDGREWNEFPERRSI